MASLDFRTWLAELDDAQLTNLLTARPDVLHPLPPSITPLAGRLQLRASVTRALRRLTAQDLAVLEAAADLGAEFHPISRAALVERVGGEASVDKLLSYALLYGDDPLQMLPNALPPARFEAADVTPTEQAILDAIGSGTGATKDAAPDADPSRPIPQLLRRGLLVRVDSGHVRRARPQRDTTPPPPPEAHDQHHIDASATAQGLEATRQVRRVIEHVAAHPVALNRDGTLGIRAATALTTTLGPDTLRAVATASAARLIGRGEIDEDTAYLAPTKYAQDWLDAPLSDQWTTLLHGWWANPWPYWHDTRLFAERLDELPALRRLVTEQYERTPSPAAGLRYYAPLATVTDDDLTALTDEAAWIGAVASNAPTTWLRALLAGEPLDVSPHIPAEVSYVIIQADMTLLAPGPLPADMQREVEAIADLESPGLASVYRLTEASLRRALDTGRTAEDILTWLRQHSVGEVPQSIEYLLHDLASRHGNLRGGAALSYLRSDDPSLLDALPDVSLRRLAPTVAISTRRLADVLHDLAEHGIHATAEDNTGAIVDIRPDPPIVPAEKIRQPDTPTMDASRVDAAIAALRSADTDDTRTYSGSDSLNILQAAARGGRTVHITVVDKNGHQRDVSVTPLTVTAGQVDARGADGQILRFPLHRVAKVHVT